MVRRHTLLLIIVLTICVVFTDCSGKSENNISENSLNSVSSEELDFTVGQFTDDAVMYEYSVSDDITEMELQLEACQGGSRVEMNSIANIVLADQSGSKGYILLYPNDELIEEYNYQLYTKNGKPAGNGTFPMSGMHEDVNIALLPEVTMVNEPGRKHIRIVSGTSLILLIQKCTSSDFDDIEFRIRANFE